MLQEIAVIVFVLNVFGTSGVLAGTAGTVAWTTLHVNDGDKANITAKLKEDSPNGLTSIKLPADNAVKYAITKQPVPGMFGINDKGTLNVTDKSALDYEMTQSYILTIKASKDDTDTATADFTLYIEDVNDNKPVFDNKEYRTTITNNTAKDTGIIQVKATDADLSDPFKTLTYKIAGASANSPLPSIVTQSLTGGNVADLFDISPSNGTIIAKTDIHVTNVTIYNLTVQADDNGGADQMHGTTTVKICVGCPDSGVGQSGVALSLMSLALLLALQN